MAKLAIKNENVTPFGGIYHIMDVFSKLGLGNRRLGLVKPGSHVDLDFDHQFIPAHKFDAKYSYKQDFGYFPGWASIGGIIVGARTATGTPM